MKSHLPLATVMHHCRASLVAGILAMDTRGTQLTPTSFKEAGALNPHNMARICAYMAGKKATLAGMKQLCSQYRQREMFEWHVYHRDPRSHEFVHSSRRMPPLFAPPLIQCVVPQQLAVARSRPPPPLSQGMKLPSSTC